MPKKRRASRRTSVITTLVRKIKRYGWIPDILDQRDYLYAAPSAFLRALPPRVWVVMPSAPSATISSAAGSFAGIVGEQAGGCAATSPSPSLI
jgi:hypothetical protein